MTPHRDAHDATRAAIARLESDAICAYQEAVKSERARHADGNAMTFAELETAQQRAAGVPQ